MFAVLLALTLAADVDPEPPGAHLKVVASVDWSELRLTPHQLEKHHVARSAIELLGRPKGNDDEREKTRILDVDHYAKRAFGVKEIDWNKQMILVIAAGRKPTAGYRIEVKELTVRGGTLKVKWKLDEKGVFGGGAITYPAKAILVPAHKGKVVFEQVK